MEAFIADEKMLAAYCAMVEAISEHARAMALDDRTDIRKYYPELSADEILYSNEYMSTFENVADALVRLNIMKHLDASCSIFTCEPQHEYELARVNWPNGPPFSELLEAFIDLFAEYCTEYRGFGTSPDTPFTTTSRRLASAMNALVEIGYAERMEGGFRWTSKARPAMVAKGSWSEEADDRGG